MARFNFSKYCTPAQLYLVVAGIGLLAAAIRKFRALTLLANGILVLVWTWILNLLCRKGLTAISWILVLLPFVFVASSYFLAMDAADAKIVEGYGLGGFGSKMDKIHAKDMGVSISSLTTPTATSTDAATSTAAALARAVPDASAGVASKFSATLSPDSVAAKFSTPASVALSTPAPATSTADSVASTIGKLKPASASVTAASVAPV